MKKLIQPILAAAALFLLGTGAHAQTADRGALVARGRYLVVDVIGCADCHAPRNERGEFIPSQWLMGSVLPFAPTMPMPVWAPVAPPIAGLPTMNEAEAVKFLRTGVKPDGSRPRPPMPEIRLNEEDARAVVAYLKSLAR